jgi:hypothetical protein
MGNIMNNQMKMLLISAEIDKITGHISTLKSNISIKSEVDCTAELSILNSLKVNRMHYWYLLSMVETQSEEQEPIKFIYELCFAKEKSAFTKLIELEIETQEVRKLDFAAHILEMTTNSYCCFGSSLLKNHIFKMNKNIEQSNYKNNNEDKGINYFQEFDKILDQYDVRNNKQIQKIIMNATNNLLYGKIIDPSFGVDVKILVDVNNLYLKNSKNEYEKEVEKVNLLCSIKNYFFNTIV